MGSLSLRVSAFTLLALVVLTSCPSPSGGTSTVSADPAPASPAWVKAEYVKTPDSVRITWEPVALSFQLYRSLGGGSWEKVGSPVATSSYSDPDYYGPTPDAFHPKLVQYAVQSLGTQGASALSVASNPTSPVVLNAEATLFSQTGGIHLKWAPHSEAEGYRIYRYPNGTGSTPVLVNETAQGVLAWDDLPPTVSADPKPNLPYYYRVTWKKGGEEYGTSGPFILGAYGTSEDLYEPNEDWSVLHQASVFNDSQPPLIYSFDDGNGGSVKDTDWYEAIVPAGQTMTVKVTLPVDTPFTAGELRFRFFSKDIESPQQAVNPGPSGTNLFTFTPDTATGGQIVYFQIEPELASHRNAIGSYSVTVGNDL